MERSRVTVEFRHLYQQVFEHEAEGVHCVVQKISGGVPEHLTLDQALDAVQSRLEAWQASGGPMEGFALPVTDYRENYRLIVPTTVEWDLWPRVYSCERCGRVFQTDRDTALRRKCVQSGCGGVHRQLPYYQVHRCGRRLQLAIPRCKNDPNHVMRFHDSGSFYTAYFTCAVCNQRHEINASSCRCTMQLEPMERRCRLVRARDTKAYYGHHVTVVNISAKIAKALATNRGPLWAAAHYLGTVENLDGLVDEASGRRSGRDDDANMRRIREILEAQSDLDDATRKSLLGTVNAKRGEEPGLDRAAQLVPSSVLDQARGDRRLLERAFIFHERGPEDLHQVAQRYRAGGHDSMAARMDAGIQGANLAGFSRVSVVRELPIALVGFGFTREFPDHRAQLKPLEPSDRERASKRPLVAIESNTEAIFFELDPHRLWSWCRRNGWTDGQAVAPGDEARAWLLKTTYQAQPGPAALAIQRLTHAWAHTLIHALEGKSAFGPNSVAEYLMERTASFLLYVANYSTFNLGGLTTHVEQHLAEWIGDAQEQTTCVHDPVCLAERGGCHKCLALAFHCERFNRGLHRGYLLGSRLEPAVAHGWQAHAYANATT